MRSPWIRRVGIAVLCWLPFFTIWTLTSISLSSRVQIVEILTSSLITMGSGGVLGIGVWYACRRWPWPPRFEIGFYLLQIVLAALYGVSWTAAIVLLEYLRSSPTLELLLAPSSLLRQSILGMWFYAVVAGIAHAVQTRDRLQDKEMRAAKAEALASSARLEALRARLNPHFMFNALHTLAALVKFRPALAEGAVERLGDMLRYTLKEDNRGLVEFAEEIEFTKQYLAFEQLRYESRLDVDLQIDPNCYDFDLPPFAIQSLAENAVHHAIAIRPEGGSIWISCAVDDGRLRVRVRDDGPGAAEEHGESHQFGLRSVRERLRAAFGPSAELHAAGTSEGFEATFVVPALATAEDRQSGAA